MNVSICDVDKVVASSGLYFKDYTDASVDFNSICTTTMYDSTRSEEGIKPLINRDLKARFIQPIFREEYNRNVVAGAIIVFEPYNFIKEAEEFSSDSAKMLLESYANYLEDLTKEVSNW